MSVLEKLSPKERRRQVTDEPFRIDADLLGAPLATIKRRAFAMSVDLVIALVVAVPLLLFASWLALRFTTPELAHLAVTTFVQRDYSQVDWDEATIQLVELVERRRPEILPVEVRQAAARADREAILAATESLRVNFDLGASAPSEYDVAADRLVVRSDILVGPARSVVSFLGLGALYFTLLTWVGGGRTPGKFLFGIQVRRLDGAKLGLRSSFDRAGGYAASVSTVGLGFAQAVRDPNRQTLHDRIAGTVVIRDRSGWLAGLRARFVQRPAQQ